MPHGHATASRRSDSDADLLRRVGVVVVAHARTDLALRCVESLGPWPPLGDVVVVMNAPASTDPAGLAELHRRVRVVSPEEPQGYGANVNLGTRSLREGLDYWVITNDDVEFREGALARLASRLAEDPSIGIAAPALYSADGRISWAYAPFPTPLGALLSMAILPLRSAWAPLQRRAGAYGPSRYEPTADAWICGAVMIVRRRAFLEVGGFDEDFFLYCEEIDLCFRLRNDGWKVAWVSSAAAVHLAGSSAVPYHGSNVLLQSRRLYLLKRLGRTRLVALQAAQLLVLALSCVYNLFASAVRPRSARHRFSLVWDRYRGHRLFLLGRRIGPGRETTRAG